MRNLPTGTLTLVFTDVEGSTTLLRAHGSGYAELLAEHRGLLRDAFALHGGVEVDTQGDAFFFVFRAAGDAAAAALDGQRALAATPVRVRIGLHTGEPLVTDEGYVGIDVHHAARVAACGHGGQIVVSASTRALLADTVELVDLGEHRLKDLGEPERLFQLGAGGFAPLKTLDATNLPLATSPLVGRGQELEEVLALLTNGSREVTVTGPGGTGKTRFALQVAAELVGEFRDGVFWVPLAAVADPELVEPEIAQTLGARDSLPGFLHGKEMLLLLDNFEHLLGAASSVARCSRGRAGCACSRRAGAHSICRSSASIRSIRCHRPMRKSSSSASASAIGRDLAAGRADRGHLSQAGRASARSRAGRRSDEAPHAGDAAGAARLRALRSSLAELATHRSVRGRCGRRSPGVTTCSTREPATARPAVRLRRRVPARRRRGRLRRGARDLVDARRREPAESHRGRPLSSARHRSRVRRRAARGRGREPTSTGVGTPTTSRRSQKRRMPDASRMRSNGRRGSSAITTTFAPHSIG